MEPDPSPVKAQAYYKQGLEYKKQGLLDPALTEFKRAVLSDPDFLEAHLECGMLYRKKGANYSVFNRFAYESFRKAAKLDINHEEAHHNYIIAAQKMGLLDQLVVEYDALIKEDPDNVFLKQCKKNILTISMAMIPDKAGAIDSGMNNNIRKVLLLVSLGLVFVGFILMISPGILRSMKIGNLEKDQLKGLVRVGVILEVAAAAGFVIRSRFR